MAGCFGRGDRGGNERHQQWAERWKDRIADNGAELASARASKTISLGKGGNPVVTDGPYLKLKEVLGGWVVLIAVSFDEAVEVAGTWPTIASHGNTVEVRPIVER